MHLKPESVDWRRLLVARAIDRGEFDFRISADAWSKAECRGVDVHEHGDGTLGVWINEDFPAVTGTDIGRGM